MRLRKRRFALVRDVANPVSVTQVPMVGGELIIAHIIRHVEGDTSQGRLTRQRKQPNHDVRLQ